MAVQIVDAMPSVVDPHGYLAVAVVDRENHDVVNDLSAKRREFHDDARPELVIENVTVTLTHAAVTCRWLGAPLPDLIARASQQVGMQ